MANNFHTVVSEFNAFVCQHCFEASVQTVVRYKCDIFSSGMQKVMPLSAPHFMVMEMSFSCMIEKVIKISVTCGIHCVPVLRRSAVIDTTSES